MSLSEFKGDRATSAIGRRRQEMLAPYLEGAVAGEIGANGRLEMESTNDVLDVVVADRRLQDIPDYRAALQQWFGALKVGGHLIVVVPHTFLCERQSSLPSRRRPAQRRLYTPASLIGEVEEALAPNSYRVRLLRDDDADYDYDDVSGDEREGAADILLILERIPPPAWGLDAVARTTEAGPDYAFEAPRTRVERATWAGTPRIILLKLDHLGDFVMGIASLQRARQAFADAHITLVVGSWNYDMAIALGVADEVIAFDAYPRNSSEDRVDVVGKTGLFEARITGSYDLAVDLRVDSDTRFLLNSIKASLRAGIGARSEFPFLDIFLPIDATRHEPETAREEVIGPRHFLCRSYCSQSDFRISCPAEQIVADAVIWGPYFKLRPGAYIFEPYIEADSANDGILFVDIAIDEERVAQATLPSAERVQLRFSVKKPGSRFEFRVGPLIGQPGIDFSFFGGKLIRQGASSVLHQSEYASLLIELVAMRTERLGLLQEIAVSE